SGVLLADLVSATVVTSRDRSGQKKVSLQERHLNRRNIAAAAGLNGVSPSYSAGSVDVSSLPPERVARELYRAYFENDHFCYPFLHRQTAFSMLKRAYEDPAFLEQNAFLSFVFDMVLAIATASGPKFNLEALPDAEAYQVRATQRLNEVLQDGGIQALQALLLLCQYRMINSIQDTSTSMWHIVGIAARMCFELGLHREQTYWPISNAMPDQLISNETRRRCFWCTVAMDRIVSITLGRPLAIYLHDANVGLPDLNLDILVNQTTTDCDDSSSPTFSRTQLFNHIVRYRVICGDILTALHNVSSRTQMDEASPLISRDKLAQQLGEWHKATEELSLPDVDLCSPLLENRSSFRAREWYEMLYHNALLMLYRPSPALPSVSSRDAIVLQTIFMSAKKAITLYSHLHRSRRINYTWITLHSIFMAGLSYIYAVGQHFRFSKQSNITGPNLTSRPSLQSDPTIMEIVNDSRACSNLLVAISEQWNVTKHCHDVFNRLSDAALSDAIQYHSKTFVNPPSDTSRSIQQETNHPPLRDWDIVNEGNTSLGVDSVLYECFGDLRRPELYGAGNDPVGQLFHDWLGEIGGIDMNQPSMWG
ncbi:fungal-specific transcription factor domain-containing protein, partial [Talaromyces proteolyticus]